MKDEQEKESKGVSLLKTCQRSLKRDNQYLPTTITRQPRSEIEALPEAPR